MRPDRMVDPPDCPDADGDTICDGDEERSANVDTDGDGTPDYMDEDSDDDGIPDRDERGPGSGAPVDSDGDGVPDFRDLDSDGNGIPDATEGTVDTDGDGLGDFADLDNDGDSIRDANEIGDDPSSPIDYDGDGLPDYLDVDSDDDTIGDLHEAIPSDTDEDGIPDRQDLDSDGDGWSDAEEAGDADFLTPPVDSDMDGTPDFRDFDSDGDGLSDARERELGTDRTSRDTDGDGVPDSIEVGACDGSPECIDDATNPDSSPRTRGGFFFEEPYMMPPMPTRDTLDFATDIQFADVYFIMDTTGSMGSSISALQTAIRDSLIPGIRAEIPGTNFGLGEFRDYPTGTYGSGGDRPYANFQDITDDVAAAQAATSGYRPSGGYDGPESHGQAMYAIATGDGLPAPSGLSPRTDCPAGTHGYPCFRDGAVPIVVMITDIYWHNGPGDSYPYTSIPTAPSYADVVAATIDNNIRFIGIGQGSSGIPHMTQFGRDVGSVDAGGNPFVTTYGGSASALTTTVVEQIRALADSTAFDITVEYEDDASDGVDSFAAFVDHIEANTAGDPARGCEPRAADDTDGDGYPDTFRDVAGDRVCFDIVVKQNDTVMPTPDPQVFRATLRVIGDGFTELDARDVFFLVPGEPEGPGGPD